MNLEKPLNQYALVVYILIENYHKGVTMLDVMRSDKFHKFQSRLLEVQKLREHKMKMMRLRVTTKNRFGHPCSFVNYKSKASLSYLHNLLKKLNREGLKK